MEPHIPAGIHDAKQEGTGGVSNVEFPKGGSKARRGVKEQAGEVFYGGPILHGPVCQGL